jgi:hypothetical protein
VGPVVAPTGALALEVGASGGRDGCWRFGGHERDRCVSIAAAECSDAGGSRFCSHIRVTNGRIAAQESATPSLPEQATVTQRSIGPTDQ